MKFVADEGVDAPIVHALREEGHDVHYIAETNPSIGDEEVLAIATAEERILITLDKDFGELVYRDKLLHHGIILGRLDGIKPKTKALIVAKVIQDYQDELSQTFIVIQPGIVRLKKMRNT